MRNVARAAVIAIGALYAWHWRFYVNPDGVAYFDVADALLRRGWFAAMNDHRSPVVPLLLALTNHVSPYYESTAAHGIVFLMYCGAFVALERLLAALRNDALVPIAYLLFLWACNFALETGPASLTPDLLVAAAIFLGSAYLVRIANGERTWRIYLALGTTLGLGYLSKEAMLPIGLFLLAAAAIAGGRKSLPRASLAFALFAAIACFYIILLSMKLGRFSTGEVSRYNLVMWVASTGTPIHPRPVIVQHPLIVAYPDDAGRGTYAVHDDFGYWLAGLRPRFDARAQLLRIRHSIGDYSAMLGTPLHFALLVVFLALLFASPNIREPLRRHWYLTAPALAVLAMYGLVLVLPRYVSPSIAVLWIGLFAGFDAETLRRARPLLTAGAVAVFLALATSRDTLSELEMLRRDPVPHDWLIAQRLRQAGIQSGDRVAVAAPPSICYWARLAQVRIAAEVVERDHFSPTAATTEALRRFGIRAIVAGDSVYVVSDAKRITLPSGS
ncbi:MAG TPA: hypothetical protein VJ901_10740 [Thermoanaerobaculia bacterium]|nr:hypothetical protein [Thermoanaerobaculia bacterium]